MSTLMLFTILGKVKPYVRMTQKSKWVDPQAQEYLASQAEIAAQIKNQMAHNGWYMLPAKTPLGVKLSFGMPKWLHNQDFDNQTKAVIDAAQGIVFKNDQWIDWAQVYRYKPMMSKEFTTTLEVFILSSHPGEWGQSPCSGG